MTSTAAPTTRSTNGPGSLPLTAPQVGGGTLVLPDDPVLTGAQAT